MSQNLNILAGEVIVFTCGEYSDYGIDSYAVAIKSFNLKREAELFCAPQDKDNRDSGRSYYDFVTHLIAKELLIPVAHREIHLGSYGEFHDEIIIVKKD